jgi:hypothetical protein
MIFFSSSEENSHPIPSKKSSKSGQIRIRNFRRKLYNVRYCNTVQHTEIRSVSIGAKFCICTVVDLNGTLLKLKYALECAYFSLNMCLGANVKFSTKCDETDYSASGN